MGRPVTQWQVVTRAPEEHARFYAELFDWEIDQANPMGYRRVRTDDAAGLQGGFWPAPPEASPFVQLIVDVEDVDAAVERATALGARVIVPPSSLPEGDRMAVLHDPQGCPSPCTRGPPADRGAVDARAVSRARSGSGTRARPIGPSGPIRAPPTVVSGASRSTVRQCMSKL